MRTNIRKSRTTHQPCGGINFIHGLVRKLRLHRRVDTFLGNEKRPAQCKYRYSDVIFGWIYLSLMGAYRLEHRKKKRLFKVVRAVPGMLIPSPDRIAHIFKQLAVKNTVLRRDTGNHTFNIHLPLNSLLITLAKDLGYLQPGTLYTADYDNTVVFTQKSDAEITYAQNKTGKSRKGYCPGVFFVNGIPVYIENRNGRSNPAFDSAGTITRALDLLEKSNIAIGTIRLDSGYYNKATVYSLESRHIQYFIRAQHSRSLYAHLKTAVWEKIQVKIDGKLQWKEVTSIYYAPFGKKSLYRFIVERNSTRKTLNKYTGDYATYGAIITNNETMSPAEVLKFYHKRAESELRFSDLNAVMNWHRPPFGKFEQNTVYFLVGAIGYLLFRMVKKEFSKKCPLVHENQELSTFQDAFLDIGFYWVVTRRVRDIDLSDEDGHIRFYLPLRGLLQYAFKDMSTKINKYREIRFLTYKPIIRNGNKRLD